MLLLLLLSFYPTQVSIPEENSQTFAIIERIRSNKELMNNIQYNEERIKKLIAAIIWNESSNGTLTENSNELAAKGIMQQHPEIIDDVNHLLGFNKYHYNDRLDPIKSIEIFLLYQKKYNPGMSIEKAARIWNGGPNGMNEEEYPEKCQQTAKYWSKIQEFMKDDWYNKSIIHNIDLPSLNTLQV